MTILYANCLCSIKPLSHALPEDNVKEFDRIHYYVYASTFDSFKHLQRYSTYFIPKEIYSNSIKKLNQHNVDIAVSTISANFTINFLEVHYRRSGRITGKTISTIYITFLISNFVLHILIEQRSKHPIWNSGNRLYELKKAYMHKAPASCKNPLPT